MTYELVGIYPAPQYFLVEANTGIVRTMGNIKNDPLQLLSYTVSSHVHSVHEK